MAEAIGLLGTLFAVVQISAKVITTCYEYQACVNGASKEIVRIQNEVISLRNVLESVLKLANNEEAFNRMPTLRTLLTPDDMLTECLKDLRDLRSELKTSLGKWRTAQRALTWPLKKEMVKKTLESVVRTKSTVNLALNSDNA